MKPLPSYAPTTTWDKGAYLIHWTSGGIQLARAKKPGRSLNSPNKITFVYYCSKAANYKLRELRGEIEVPKEKRGAFGGRGR